MAEVSRAVLKTYFQDGKEPDENKFIDLIDTMGLNDHGPTLKIDGAAGQQRDIRYRSGDLLRWLIMVTGETESGGNAGSNLTIQSRKDDGTWLANPLKILRASGDIQLKSGADIFTEPWTPYHNDTNITGWSSFTTKVLNYKRFGKLVFVEYRFAGPGNNTTVQFTVPFDCKAAARHVHAIGRSRDNNNWGSGVAYGRTTGGSDVISLCKFASSGITGSWSALTGTRHIEGEFFYESA